MQKWKWLAVVFAVPAASPAFAQQVSPPPARPASDGNGVDLVTGAFSTRMTDVSVGPSGSQGLAFTRDWTGNGFWPR